MFLVSGVGRPEIELTVPPSEPAQLGLAFALPPGYSISRAFVAKHGEKARHLARGRGSEQAEGVPFTIGSNRLRHLMARVLIGPAWSR